MYASTYQSTFRQPVGRQGQQRCSYPGNSQYTWQGGVPVGNNCRRQGSMTSAMKYPHCGSSMVYGGQPYGYTVNLPGSERQTVGAFQQQQSRGMNQPTAQKQGFNNRTRSTPVHPVTQAQQSLAVNPTSGLFAGMKTYATTTIPQEVESNPNTQYVRLNWEDLLGGQNGLHGLQVSMNPSPSGDKTQLSIGMGSNAVGGGSADGSSQQLRVVSFQPVENYPGLKQPTEQKPGQPIFKIVAGTDSQQKC